ncbi:MAG TPA: HEAT repeat domain-containing protein [Blastocatellia bacterium]|nr:HEAT repeat domain-containing protein [Blastocatellia bacterium]
MDFVRLKDAKVFKTELLAALLLFLICVGHPAVTLQAQSRDRERAAQELPESAFESQHREASSKNPEGVSFTLRLRDGKKQFRQGEVIRLELGFASSMPRTYRMSTASYDRSGRLEMDKFHLEPDEGLADPLYDHFHPGFGFMGGGLSSIHDLKTEPYLINYELNEWFRFDRPGRYRLYITSPRVGRIKAGEQYKVDSLTVTSNVIEFEVLPAEPEWLEKEFQRAVQILDDKSNQAVRRDACHILRYLGSEAAAGEMIRRLGDDDAECGFDYYAGLVGSPQRNFVLNELEKQIASPTQPVSGGYLHLLSLLVLTSQHPIPPAIAADEKYWRRRQDAYGEIQKRHQEKLAAAVAQKIGRAKAISVQTLLEQGWDRSRLRGLLPEIASIFEDLPRDRQRQMLEYGWKQIASPALLPILRRFYEKPSQDDRYLREVALRRIYELAPEEGRRLIIAEMQSPRPGVGMSALTILPDEALPELDQILADRLEQGGEMDIISGLIERYATSAVSPRVRAFYEEKAGKWACTIQANLLAYLLRTDPESGAQLVRGALQARSKEDTGCWTNTLGEIGRLHTCPELEKVAIASLDDPNPEVVRNAIELLGRYGSAEAEEPLWRCFEKWHREWGGRVAELTNYTLNESRQLAGRQLETSLWQALISSPGWLADPKKLVPVQQLCLSDEARQQVGTAIERWAGEIHIAFAPGADKWGYVEVAQYTLNSPDDLKRKLTQFPKGTVFKWQPFNQGQQEEEKEKLFSELKSFLEARGMKLNR